MHTLLIAIDFDPSSKNVAETGYAFAKAMHAQVILLHVISDPVYYSSTVFSPIMGFGGYMDLDFLQTNIIEDLITTNQKFLDATKKHLGDHTIQTKIAEGNVSDTIVETSQKMKADMIIMGSHSRKWLDAVLMGSVTEKVLHHSKIPILIVPTHSRT